MCVTLYINMYYVCNVYTYIKNEKNKRKKRPSTPILPSSDSFLVQFHHIFLFLVVNQLCTNFSKLPENLLEPSFYTQNPFYKLISWFFLITD